MSALDADDWLAAVLADEGWQAPLEDASRTAVVARLEALLPPGAKLSEGDASRLGASLRELAAVVERLSAGDLDEGALVGAWLRAMRV
jgi:hypothetical protein